MVAKSIRRQDVFWHGLSDLPRLRQLNKYPSKIYVLSVNTDSALHLAGASQYVVEGATVYSIIHKQEVAESIVVNRPMLWLSKLMAL